jgi:hypothetical protein
VSGREEAEDDIVGDGLQHPDLGPDLDAGPTPDELAREDADGVARQQTDALAALSKWQKPGSRWWIYRHGPDHDRLGRTIPTGLYPGTILGEISIEKIFARVGGGELAITPHDPTKPGAQWTDISVLGEPRAIDFDARAEAGAPAPAAPASPPAPATAPSDEVDHYDGEGWVRIRRSELERRRQAAAAKRPDPVLAELQESRRTMSELVAGIAKLAENMAKPPPAPPAPAETPWKDFFALEQKRTEAEKAKAEADRTRLEAEIERLKSQGPPERALAVSGGSPDTKELLGFIFDAAEKLNRGKQTQTEVGALRDVLDRACNGIDRMWSEPGEGPLAKIFSNLATATEPLPAPAGAAAPAAAGAATAAPATVPAVNPAQALADALMIVGDTLEGKLAAEDGASRIRGKLTPKMLTALQQPLEKLVETINKAAGSRLFVNYAERLKAISARATGEGRPVAEKLVAALRAES